MHSLQVGPYVSRRSALAIAQLISESTCDALEETGFMDSLKRLQILRK